MIMGMTSAKIAVSLPERLVVEARRAVRRGSASSVSALVAQSLAERLKLEDLTLMLDEMLAETGGPLTRTEKAAAEAELGMRPRRKGRAA
jgi:Arc/MetJ-type ribon-helix-helix transcriptional regulator